MAKPRDAIQSDIRPRTRLSRPEGRQSRAVGNCAKWAEPVEYRREGKRADRRRMVFRFRSGGRLRSLFAALRQWTGVTRSKCKRAADQPKRGRRFKPGGPVLQFLGLPRR